MSNFAFSFGFGRGNDYKIKKKLQSHFLGDVMEFQVVEEKKLDLEKQPKFKNLSDFKKDVSGKIGHMLKDIDTEATNLFLQEVNDKINKKKRDRLLLRNSINECKNQDPLHECLDLKTERRMRVLKRAEIIEMEKQKLRTFQALKSQFKRNLKFQAD